MNGGIATPEEVLAVISAIMQGTFRDAAGHGPKVSERCRAVELLAKHYGLFLPAEPDRAEARKQAAALISEAVEAWIAGKEAEAASTGTPCDG